MSTARSIHVGMSFGSPSPKYGDGGVLAKSFGRWAAEAGYRPTLLIDADATPQAVLSAIYDAAKDSRPGDCLLITYTGHGGRAIDQDGDENGTDAMDSTWSLSGGDLLDDQLTEVLGAVQQGVRVVVIVDSCYSQTMVEASTPSGEVLFIAAAPDNSTVQAGRLSAYLLDILPRLQGQSWWDLLSTMRTVFKAKRFQGPYFPQSPDPKSASLPLYLRGP